MPRVDVVVVVRPLFVSLAPVAFRTVEAQLMRHVCASVYSTSLWDELVRDGDERSELCIILLKPRLHVILESRESGDFADVLRLILTRYNYG